METITMEVLHKDIKKLYREVRLIRNIVSEKYELSDWAKKELKGAREEMKSKTVPHGEIMKKYA